MIGLVCWVWIKSDSDSLNLLLQRWVAFQLLKALSQCHEKGVCHGDVKCENVLVTSWNWVLLADFASYKPAYLPADNPVPLIDKLTKGNFDANPQCSVLTIIIFA